MLSIKALVQAWLSKCLITTWLIHSLSSTCYVSDTILGARDPAVNQRDIDPFPMERISQSGRRTISR